MTLRKARVILENGLRAVVIALVWLGWTVVNHIDEGFGEIAALTIPEIVRRGFRLVGKTVGDRQN